MNFAQAATLNAAGTRTENGAYALNTTGSKLLDFFAVAGALRGQDSIRIERLFDDAFAEDPLGAVRTLFYLRDVRGGLGERSTFRLLIRHLAQTHPEALVYNVGLIPEYGRWDDLYVLDGTPLEINAYATISNQLNKDLADLEDGQPVSLAAKWVKSPNNKNNTGTALLGKRTAEYCGYNPVEFRKILSKLRAKLKIVERDMSANKWGAINYPAVPSRAMHVYNKAFNRHDQERFDKYMKALERGEAKINSSTLYPYDILRKIWGLDWWRSGRPAADPVAEAQWKALPNYVGSHKAIVMADTSGSMCGLPMYISVSLAIYFAERNTSAYKDLWMSFSSQPKMQRLKGQTLQQKLKSLNMDAWQGSTNLEAAFQLVLDIAIANHVQPDDMPESIIVISDMEIDCCARGSWTFYDLMKKRYEDSGYRIPNIVFWNVQSRHDTFHVDGKRQGVQLVSGASPSVFKQVMGMIGTTPVENMYAVLNSERYAAIKIERSE